ncbi:MAG: ABC transporter ATP-binding protein [Clostridiales bacterium]|jgi:ABC-type lipoprotein export system ATPase subunit|nr:ABC transporter ATP-binding protein [Clostridiales bacterium]
MIEIEDLSKNFGAFRALSEINLKIEKGEFTALVGDSGSGKSTLLNLIGQIDEPTEGDILIDGVSTVKMSEKEKSKLRNGKFGFVFQAFYLESGYSVYKNLEIPLIIKGVPKKERTDIIKNALNSVGMETKLRLTAAVLSGGEKQRVAIARALTCDPEIILADEPCGNLDSKNSKIVLDLLRDLHKKGKTIIMVTHNLTHTKYAGRVIRLSDGAVVNDIKNP